MPFDQPAEQEPGLGDYVIAEYKTQMSAQQHVAMMTQAQLRQVIAQAATVEKELRKRIRALESEIAALKDSAETIKIEATPGELVDVKPARQKQSAG